MLKTLPESVGDLKGSLKRLDLSYNYFEGDPNIWGLLNLEELKFSSCFSWTNISRSVPREVGLFSRLTALDLSGNFYGVLPSELSSVTTLKILKLGNNLIEYLPEGFNNLTELEVLELQDNPFKVDPQLKHPKLRELRFNLTWEGYFNSFPKFNLGGVIEQSLEVLSFSTQIEPTSLRQSRLREIFFSPEYGNLPLPELPLSIETFWYSGIVNVSESVFDSYYLNMTHLFLYQSFYPFPSCWNFGATPNLQILEFGGYMPECPLASDLTKLTNLKSLRLFGDLSGESVPTELGSLSRLETLTLESILSTSWNGPLPKELAKLDSLQSLRVDSTYLSGELDGSLKKLNNLPSCEFGDNEKEALTCISESVFGETICGIVCVGRTIDGLWLTKDSQFCSSDFEITDFGIEFQDDNFVIRTKYQLLHSEQDQDPTLILSMGGWFEVLSEIQDEKDQNRVNVEMNLHVENKTGFATGFWEWSSGIYEIQTEFDASTLESFYHGLRFHPLDPNLSIPVNLTIDFHNQRLEGDLFGVLPDHCESDQSPRFDLRRWWDCDEFSTSKIDCTPKCGDGVVISPEQCEDGNHETNDGCSNYCEVERGWECSSQGCEPICGDQLIVTAHDCDLWLAVVGSVIGVIVILIVSGWYYNYSVRKRTALVIKCEQLKLVSLLGEGAFGQVFKGVWRGNTSVAIKVIKEVTLTKQEIEDFTKEAALFHKLPPHPNIVQFLGISIGSLSMTEELKDKMRKNKIKNQSFKRELKASSGWGS
eukprot:TRINITY_DN232_c0_g5_i1.p1 TRINITY_DN232_c0_g5~~TRINITY_DN232_c0_g5_i1.p1  ORF type:complete len:763 (-),score=190.75 TRINITY_DN232_c0_g5_i1:1326-3614(-)